jgi:hypothetical protein
MTKLTAVEWLNDELSKIFYLESNLGSEFESSQLNLWMIKIIAEAKAMEKEQLENAYFNGGADNMNDEGSFKEYFNETYGGDK